PPECTRSSRSLLELIVAYQGILTNTRRNFLQISYGFKRHKKRALPGRKALLFNGSLFQRHGEEEPGGGLVALGLQSSLVLRRNGGGDGQPQAEAGLLPPGGVRPVESLEQAAQLVRWDGIAGVGYQQTGLPVCAPQGQADGTPRLPILDGVVQQDADQLAQFVGVAGDGHVGGDVALQGLSRLKGHRLKGQYAVRGQVGERDLPHHRR
ncbi:SMI1/KNR4 family protein, partial [Dysosmobacter welbionis]